MSTELRNIGNALCKGDKMRYIVDLHETQGTKDIKPSPEPLHLTSIMKTWYCRNLQGPGICFTLQDGFPLGEYSL